MAKTYTNRDADRQYGRGREIVGPWTSVRPRVELDEDAFDVDALLADAKRATVTPGQLRAQLAETENRQNAEAAQARAQRGSSKLASLFTSVFSPQQRESTARWIEGDARDKPGILNRGRSFLAGAIGGAGEESDWGGAMGEVTPFNVATSGTVAKALPKPVRTFLLGERIADQNRSLEGARLGRIRDAQGGRQSLLDAEAADRGTVETFGGERFRRPDLSGTPTAGARSTERIPYGATTATDALPGSGVRELEAEGAERFAPNVSNPNAGAASLEDAATPRLPALDRFMPNRSNPRAGLASAEDAAIPRLSAIDRFMPNRPGTVDAGDPAVAAEGLEGPIDRFMPNRPAVNTETDPEASGSFLSGILDRFMPNRGARTVAADPEAAADVPESLLDRYMPNQPAREPAISVPEPTPEVSPEPVRGFGRVTPRADTPAGEAGGPITDPRRMLPAAGGTSETAAYHDRLLPGHAKSNLLSQRSTEDLAQEYLRSVAGPNVTLRGIKGGYLMPQGTGELERTLRQRGHIARKANKRMVPDATDATATRALPDRADSSGSDALDASNIPFGKIKPAAPYKSKKSKDFANDGIHHITTDDGQQFEVFFDRASGNWYENKPTTRLHTSHYSDLFGFSKGELIDRLRARAAGKPIPEVGRGGDEAGFAGLEPLMFAGRTIGGGLIGGATADEGEKAQGVARGALAGAVLPSVLRGGGRFLKALRSGSARQAGESAVDEVQNLRYMGALSGKAVPKSFAGNVSAPFIAAAERGTTEPIGAFFSPKTLARFRQEMDAPSPGAHTVEQESPNIFSRVLSAGDMATTDALQRAGISEEDAARYLLRTPTGKLGLTGQVGDLMRSRLGRAALMFQTSPINQVVHGASNIAGIRPPSGVSPNRLRLLSAAAAAAGAVEGGVLDADPAAIAMTAPFAGPYSVPLLLGAAGGKLLRGQKGDARATLRGVSPAPELGTDVIDPRQFVRPITRPAIESYFRESSDGRRTREPRRGKTRRARKPRG